MNESTLWHKKLVDVCKSNYRLKHQNAFIGFVIAVSRYGSRTWQHRVWLLQLMVTNKQLWMPLVGMPFDVVDTKWHILAVRALNWCGGDVLVDVLIKLCLRERLVRAETAALQDQLALSDVGQYLDRRVLRTQLPVPALQMNSKPPHVDAWKAAYITAVSNDLGFWWWNLKAVYLLRIAADEIQELVVIVLITIVWTKLLDGVDTAVTFSFKYQFTVRQASNTDWWSAGDRFPCSVLNVDIVGIHFTKVLISKSLLCWFDTNVAGHFAIMAHFTSL